MLVLDAKTKDEQGLAILNVAGKTLVEPAKPVAVDAPWTWGEFCNSSREPIPAKYTRGSTNLGRVALPKNTNGKFQTLTVRVGLSPERNVEKTRIAEKQLMTISQTTFPAGEKVDDFATRLNWGKEQLIAVHTFPQRRTQLPYVLPALREYMAQFIETMQLPRNDYSHLEGNDTVIPVKPGSWGYRVLRVMGK